MPGTLEGKVGVMRRGEKRIARHDLVRARKRGRARDADGVRGKSSPLRCHQVIKAFPRVQVRAFDQAQLSPPENHRRLAEETPFLGTVLL